MKKILSLTAALAICLSIVGCMAKKNDNNTNSDMIDSTNYRVGVGSYTTTMDSSSSVEGENGKGIISTTYATVVFDENNIIKKVYIDEVESKLYFDSKGQLVDDANNDVKSKRELGDAYNMRVASGIGKEWYQQINSLESWLVGKNIEEISNGVMNMPEYTTRSKYNNYGTNYTENGTGVVGDAVNGAKNIINGIADGARNIADGNKNNADSTTYGAVNDNTTGDTMTDSTPPAPNNTDNNGNNAMDNGTNNTNPLNWEQDLKTSVTIDLTNIQRALHKAYINAR